MLAQICLGIHANHMIDASKIMFEDLFSSGGLSLERLQTLCEIAEAGSIGEATRGNKNRQSLFSRQVGELEQFFGVELLDRRTRPYVLNCEGKALVKLSRDYLSGLADFRARCLNQPLRLRIGAGESTIQWLLTPRLNRLSDELPRAVVSMDNLRTMDIVSRLESGEVDLGVIRKTALTPKLESLGSLNYGYRLFVPNRKRRKLKEKLSVDQLSQLPLAIISGKGEFRSQLEQLASEADAELDIRLECSSYAQVATAILGGEYVGFLPDYADTMLSSQRVTSFGVDGFGGLKRELVFAWSPKQASLRPLIEKAAKLLAL